MTNLQTHEIVHDQGYACSFHFNIASIRTIYIIYLYVCVQSQIINNLLCNKIDVFSKLPGQIRSPI